MSNTGFPSGFESTKGAGAVWEPKQKGSQKDNNLQALEAGEDSWITGYYLGAKHDVGKNNSILHEIKLDQVGNKDHIVGEVDNSRKVGIWGTHVLDSEIAKIHIGQMIAIKWLGPKTPLKGGKQFHSWEVFVNPNVEPLNLGSMSVNNDEVLSAPTEIPQTNAPVANAAAALEDDDDLPF